LERILANHNEDNCQAQAGGIGIYTEMGDHTEDKANGASKSKQSKTTRGPEPCSKEIPIQARVAPARRKENRGKTNQSRLDNRIFPRI
jgi:hypothetical protein